MKMQLKSVAFVAASTAPIVSHAQETCGGKSAGPHTISSVPNVYCDGNGNALVQNVDRLNSCGVLSYTEVTDLTPTGCGYLSEASVRAIAVDSFDVTLQDLGRGEAHSVGGEPLAALQTGDSWMNVPATAWGTADGWQFNAVLQTSLVTSGWPNMLQSQPGVGWLGSTENGFLPSRSSQLPPEGSRTWLRMTPPLDSCEGQLEGVYRIGDVRSVFCDGNGFALIHSSNTAGTCTGAEMSEQTVSVGLGGCSYYTDAAVRSLAERSHGVRLEDLTRTTSSIQSLNNGSLDALKTGSGFVDATWTAGWNQCNACSATTPSAASGWPNVQDSCGQAGCVDWMVQGGTVPTSEDGSVPPTASRTWLDMNTPMYEPEVDRRLRESSPSTTDLSPNAARAVIEALDQSGDNGLGSGERTVGNLNAAFEPTNVQDFYLLDTNRDGTVSVAELAARRGVSEADAQASLDAAGVTGPFDATKLPQISRTNTAVETFDTRDADNSGLIVASELETDLTARLGEAVSLEQAQAVLAASPTGLATVNGVSGANLSQYESLDDVPTVQTFVTRDTDNDAQVEDAELRALIAASNQGQAPAPVDAAAARLREAFDADGSGALSFTEQKAAALQQALEPTNVQDFALTDTDRDGLVSVAEYASRRGITQAEAQALITAAGVTAPLDLSETASLAFDNLPARFDQADIDNSGLLTAAELRTELATLTGVTGLSEAEAQAFRDHVTGTTDRDLNLNNFEQLPATESITVFVNHDNDDSGKLSQSDLEASSTAAGGTAAAGAALLALDTDGDSELSYAEYEQNGVREALANSNVVDFTDADTNGDGLVTVAEYAAYRGITVEQATGMFTTSAGDANPQHLAEFAKTQTTEVPPAQIDGSTDTTARSTDDSGLTDGELAGIIIGSILGCCLLLLLLLLLLCCCKRCCGAAADDESEESENERKYRKTEDVQEVREPYSGTQDTRALDIPVVAASTVAVGAAAAGAVAYSTKASPKETNHSLDYTDGATRDMSTMDDKKLMIVRNRSQASSVPPLFQRQSLPEKNQVMPSLEDVATRLNVPVTELSQQNAHIKDTQAPLPEDVQLEMPFLRTKSGASAKLRSYSKVTGIDLDELNDANGHIADRSAPIPEGTPVYIPYSYIMGTGALDLHTSMEF